MASVVPGQTVVFCLPRCNSCRFCFAGDGVAVTRQKKGQLVLTKNRAVDSHKNRELGLISNRAFDLASVVPGQTVVFCLPRRNSCRFCFAGDGAAVTRQKKRAVGSNKKTGQLATPKKGQLFTWANSFIVCSGEPIKRAVEPHPPGGRQEGGGERSGNQQTLTNNIRKTGNNNSNNTSELYARST